MKGSSFQKGRTTCLLPKTYRNHVWEQLAKHLVLEVEVQAQAS